MWTWSAQLFMAPDIKLEHKPLRRPSTSPIPLNTESNVYEIPIAAQVGYYYPPKVENLQKGDTYTLTVGYLPGNAWTSDLSGTKYEPTPGQNTCCM